MVALSILSGAVAGSIIGNFFMAPGIITNVYGTVWLFASLHALGGLIGGVLGFILVKALELRGVLVTQIG